jgi:hypothetical protein
MLNFSFNSLVKASMQEVGSTNISPSDHIFVSPKRLLLCPRLEERDRHELPGALQIKYQ